MLEYKNHQAQTVPYNGVRINYQIQSSSVDLMHMQMPKRTDIFKKNKNKIMIMAHLHLT